MIQQPYRSHAYHVSCGGMQAKQIVSESRRRAGITQRALADLAEVSQPTIARIESGVSKPSLDRVVRLVEACGLELRVALVEADDSDWSVARSNLNLDPQARVRQHMAALRFAQAGREALARVRT